MDSATEEKQWDSHPRCKTDSFQTAAVKLHLLLNHSSKTQEHHIPLHKKTVVNQCRIQLPQSEINSIRTSMDLRRTKCLKASNIIREKIKHISKTLR